MAEDLHPLDPATAEEIEKATALVKAAFGDVLLHFKAAGLDEPPKTLLVEYLDAEHAGRPRPALPRNIFVMWYIKRTPRLFEAIVDVTNGTIANQTELPRDFHGPVDRAELSEAAAVTIADPGVLTELRRLGVDPKNVVLDPWDYGVDGKETQERQSQVCITDHVVSVVEDANTGRSSCIDATRRTTTQIPATIRSPLTLWSLSTCVP